MDILLVVIVVWVIPIFVAYSIGKGKHRAGFWYGLLLGWLGVIIVALLPSMAAPAGGTPMEQLLHLRANKNRYQPESFLAEHARLVALIESERECPFCKEQMKVDATVCPHCQRESVATVAAESEG